MASEMTGIERVARALCAACHDRPDQEWRIYARLGEVAVSELHEEMRRLYLEGLEDAAQIAERHAGHAREERLSRDRHRRPMAPDALTEILAEERGEDIASSVIAHAIRKKIATFPPADDAPGCSCKPGKISPVCPIHDTAF